jgi:hypothetical protein
MMQETPQQKRDPFSAQLNTHLIILGCGDHSQNPPRLVQYTAFVISIEKTWYLVTAGHVLRNILNALDAGKDLKNWHIDDCTGRHRVGQHPWLFNFERNRLISIYDDEEGWDYGIFQLDYLTTIALEKSGISPLDESTWEAVNIESADFLYLIGLPYELNQYTDPTAHVDRKIVGMKVKRLLDRPAGLNETLRPRIYGRIDESMRSSCGRLTDIDGMSGGPLFAVQDFGEGRLRYGVVGIQSASDTGNRVIAACPIRPFLVGVRKLARELNGNPELP